MPAPLVSTLRMIKFSHTVFALPFALAAAAVAARGSGESWTDLAPRFGLVLLCMVAARSAAMTFNRLADADIDARNPRTAGREIPSGTVSRRFAWAFFASCCAAFIGGAFLLGELAGALSVPVLFILCGYSYTKRFTFLSHLALGFCLGMAPVGAWIAVTGEVSRFPVLLGLAVLLWTAGFDVIYALQDVDFDRRAGLRSIPARFGIVPSLIISAVLHVGMVAVLVALGVSSGGGWLFHGGVILVAALLICEHWLIRPSDLSRLGAAFFTVNGVVSVVFGGLIIADGVVDLPVF